MAGLVPATQEHERSGLGHGKRRVSFRLPEFLDRRDKPGDDGVFSVPLETGPTSAYVSRRRVMLWLSSKTSHPGDLNLSLRELSLPLTVV